jgi:hypothetical protein
MEKYGGMILAGENSRPPELSSNPTSSHIVKKQEELGEGNDEFGLTKNLFSHFEGFFNMPHDLPTWRQRLYFQSEGSRAADMYRTRPGLNQGTLGPMASTLTTRPSRKTI